ncbi:MAG: aldo/keto reductase [Chloroflexota bacterium]
MSIGKRVTLNNGVKMPQFGLGVFQSKEGPEVENAVRAAIDFGYRHIDTAAIYGNEEGTGKAVRDSGIAREHMFITTKVWNSAQREGKVREALEDSLRKLDIGYIDLYLIHWAVPGTYVDTWLTLEKLYAEGKIKAIGVSNFYEPHFEDVISAGDIIPTVNQVELHPFLRLAELQSYLKQKGCYIEAWSPLMQARPELFELPTLQNIAEEHSKSVAQVILRWHWQHDIVIIPKSVNPSRIAENGSIFDFELSAAEMTAIDELDKNQRIGPHPSNFDF